MAMLDRALLLPWPMVVAALFAPTLISLASRNGYGIFCAALLDCVSIAVLAAQRSDGGHQLAAAALLASVIAAAYGFHDRRRVGGIAGVDEQLAHLREEMATYLGAIDQRAQLIDEVALSRGLPPAVSQQQLSSG